MGFARVLAVLEAYAPQRLIGGDYEDAFGDCCAIGACVPAACGQRGPIDELLYVDDDLREDPEREALEDALRDLDLSAAEALDLQGVNDDDLNGPGVETPEARYVRVLAWVRARVASGGQEATTPGDRR